jgi:hypothetical protein
MRALIDDDGAIYIFGPGVFSHVDPERWGTWQRFTGVAMRVNNRQRELVRTDCLAAREPSSLRALIDDDGAIYLFGPGIFTHLDPERWQNWYQFTGDPVRVSNRQRELIGIDCLTARAPA